MLVRKGTKLVHKDLFENFGTKLVCSLNLFPQVYIKNLDCFIGEIRTFCELSNRFIMPVHSSVVRYWDDGCFGFSNLI